MCGEGGRCSTCSKYHTQGPTDQRRTRGDIAAQEAAAARKKQEEEHQERLREPFQEGNDDMLTEKTIRVKLLTEKVAACKQNELVFKRVAGKALGDGYQFEPDAFSYNEDGHRIQCARGFDRGWWENNPEKAGKWVQGQFTPVQAVHLHIPRSIDSRTQTKAMADYSKEDYFFL